MSYKKGIELGEVFEVLRHVSGQHHVNDGCSHLTIGSSVERERERERERRGREGEEEGDEM